MTEIPFEHRSWLATISDQIAYATEAGVDIDLVLDAVAIGIELDDRAATPGGCPLSLSLMRAYVSAVGPEGEAGPTADHLSSTAPASRAAEAHEPEIVCDLAALSGAV